MSLNLSDKKFDDSKIALLGDGLIGTGLNDHIEAIDWGTQNYEYKQFSRKLTGTDFKDHEALKKLLEPFDVIINTIAHTDTKDKQKGAHWNLNYVLPAFLADLCQGQGKRLIHISTDYVYAGSPSKAQEEDIPIPFHSWYAATKLMADNYIQLRCDDYLIIRTAHKLSPFPFKNGYINVIGSFQCVYDAINQMDFLIRVNPAKGVFNIGPKDPLSIYDYAKEESELPRGKKQKVGKSVYSGKDIPLDTTMDCRKFYRFQNDYYEKDV